LIHVKQVYAITEVQINGMDGRYVSDFGIVPVRLLQQDGIYHIASCAGCKGRREYQERQEQ
jgi:hypothetical protein